MGVTMNLLDIALLALVAWTLWYLVQASAAFNALRDLQATALQREVAFMGLTGAAGQGRAQPYADRSPPSTPVTPGQRTERERPVPPLHLSDDWADAYGHHDELIRAYVYDAEADQVVLRG